ncbi:MAG: aminopeptidase [Firmicutes bacterium]|jgi:leucyl aminopeptidase (aminopeptidase T)|nr:aminopeptidase [Bacillota bacterium]
MSESAPARAAAGTILRDCLKVKGNEHLLIVTDDSTEAIAREIWGFGFELGARPMLMVMPTGSRNGEEPPRAVAEAMKGADVVVCPTRFSLSHTRARREACEGGARIATLPGITREIFEGGALRADYAVVAKTAMVIAEMLTNARRAIITGGGLRLEMSLEGRTGLADTGMIDRPGAFGNLPGGEAFIAPVEGTAEGEIAIDGSMLGGVMSEPLVLEFRRGILQSARGPGARELLQVLGETQEARNLAELGVGCNPLATLRGVVLEDEKVLGTVHVALGTNSSFGGKVSAGVHLDGVVRAPDLYLDGSRVIAGGKLLLH